MSRDYHVCRRQLRRGKQNIDHYSLSRYKRNLTSSGLTAVDTDQRSQLGLASFFSSWLKETSLRWIKPFFSHFEKENILKTRNFKKCRKKFLSNPNKKTIYFNRSFSSISVVHSEIKDVKESLA